MVRATCDKERAVTLKDAFAFGQGSSHHSILVHGLASIFAPYSYQLLAVLHAVIMA